MTMITTIYGDMDDANLIKSEGVIDNDIENTKWVEYRQEGSDEIIHRSVHMTLKDPSIFANLVPNLVPKIV